MANANTFRIVAASARGSGRIAQAPLRAVPRREINCRCVHNCTETYPLVFLECAAQEGEMADQIKGYMRVE
jgi:hypothetical protein